MDAVKSSKHSEHSEFGTWWCFEWIRCESSKHSEPLNLEHGGASEWML